MPHSYLYEKYWLSPWRIFFIRVLTVLFVISWWVFSRIHGTSSVPITWDLVFVEDSVCQTISVLTHWLRHIIDTEEVPERQVIKMRQLFVGRFGTSLTFCLGQCLIKIFIYSAIKLSELFSFFLIVKLSQQRLLFLIIKLSESMILLV